MKKSFSFTITFLTSAALITAFIGAVSGCDTSLPADSPKIIPDMIVKDFSTSSYQSGALSWTLHSKESSYFYGEKRSIAKNITLEYYENNSVSTTVTADTAIIKLDSNNIHLIGSVVMSSRSGNTLITENIMWNNGKKILETDAAVKIIKNNGDIIKGTGMTADYNLEFYEIKRDVVAVSKSIGKEAEKR